MSADYGFSMLEDVRALLVLQDRDRRLLSLAKDLEKLPQDEARAQGKLAADNKAVQAAHDALVEFELQLKRIELDVGARKTTVQRLKVQQFETRKNDEYQALGNEVIRYEKEVDALETKELELMEQIDQSRAAHKEAEAKRTKTQVLVDEDLASIRQRAGSIKADQSELNTERDQLAAAIPDSILPLYQRLLKTKAGLAVAPMQDGKCGGCHMKLIASTVVAVQTGKELSRCEDCGRILYAD
ncbi:MAG: C4-type zinc ribbon domain-containing protein [Verrucomicrobia bacterium]|nr:C4-type zinc ribbon domain-containing protein [Verrucomicrobiota bacterium]